MDQRESHTINDHHALCRYRKHIENRNSIRRQNQRVVLKSGEFNIIKSNSTKKFSFIISKFIDTEWGWCLLICIAIYVLNWLIFALIWWLILELHGDFETENLPQPGNVTEWKPCVKEIYTFTSIFLFSIEIHTAVGYGKRTITLECPSAVFTMCIESIAGHITKSVIIGIVFAKLTKPKYRRHTLLFSKNAIINQRDRCLCLLFRLGNIRKSRIISPTVKAFLIRYERESDHNILNSEQIELNVKVDGSDDILFIFPITIIHKIDENSPLYNISAKNMLELELEILVVFEGIIESTGQTVQAISSYTTQEILWGRRFSQSVYFHKRKQGFVENFGKFDESYSVNTPLCRGSDLKRYNEKRKTLLLQKYMLHLRDLV